MKELDVVLNGYLERYYPSAGNGDREQFLKLLEMPDPEIYNLLLGRDQTDDPGLTRFIEFLRGMSGKNQQGS